MEFYDIKSSAELWLSNESSCFRLLTANEAEGRLDFHAPDHPGVSFYVMILKETTELNDNNWHIWSDSEKSLEKLGTVLDFVSSCEKKSIEEILNSATMCLMPMMTTKKPAATVANGDADGDVYADCIDGEENIANGDECNDDDDDDDGFDDVYYGDEDPDAETMEARHHSDDDGVASNFFDARGSTGAIQRLSKDLRSLQKMRDAGFDASPRNSNLFQWDVKLKDFPPESELAKDLNNFAAKYNTEPVITMDMHFPNDYPFSPPFIRVVRPRFKFLTGHITIGGSVCMQMLTKSGWTPANDIELILVSVRSEIISDKRAALDPVNPNKEYTEAEAKDAFHRMVQRYNWK